MANRTKRERASIQLKHTISLSIIFMAMNIFALPSDNLPINKEFTNFKNTQEALEAEKKQDFLIKEIFSRLGFLDSADHSGLIHNGATHILIGILLRNQDSIDYKYWSVSSEPNNLKPALDQLRITLNIRSEGSTQDSLTRIAELIVRDAQSNHLKPILKKHSDADFVAGVNRDTKWAIKPHHIRMLLEVLLMDQKTIDFDYWTENLPVHRQLESNLLYRAVDETLDRLIQVDASLDPKYYDHMILLANHILTKARDIDRKLKLARFADNHVSSRRALKLQQSKKVISIKVAIKKAKL